MKLEQMKYYERNVFDKYPSTSVCKSVIRHLSFQISQQTQIYSVPFITVSIDMRTNQSIFSLHGPHRVNPQIFSGP